jgi:hypothetical protein
MSTIKLTTIGNSYWNKTGAYQSEYEYLYQLNVPNQGIAKTLNGELIRSISRLFYEYCNNGNCNACEEKIKYHTYDVTCSNCNGDGIIDEEECTNCGGSGLEEEEEEYIEDTLVTPHYQIFIDLIEKTVPYIESTINAVREIILIAGSHGTTYFDDKLMVTYNELCDKVIFYVLTNEDKEIPSWYIEQYNSLF